LGNHPETLTLQIPASGNCVIQKLAGHGEFVDRETAPA
jgi:hypothetical protein